jgi:hypothetical protein
MNDCPQNRPVAAPRNYNGDDGAQANSRTNVYRLNITRSTRDGAGCQAQHAKKDKTVFLHLVFIILPRVYRFYAPHVLFFRVQFRLRGKTQTFLSYRPYNH